MSRTIRIRPTVAPTTVALLAFYSVCLSCASLPIPARPRPLQLETAEQQLRAYYSRLNAEDLPGLLSLLADEPSVVSRLDAGAPTVRTGYRDVAQFYAWMFRNRDDQIVPEFMDVQGASAVVGWSMHGSDGEALSGTSRFSFRRGRIARIELERRE